MKIEIKDAATVTTRVQALKTRKSRWDALMQDLEGWRHMDKARVMGVIWRDEPPPNADRWTVVNPYIATTTRTVKAFFSSRRPKITATARDTTNVPQQDMVNLVERIGYALFDTIERERATPLIEETAEANIHRGAQITKVLRLSPEERGAIIETVEPDLTGDPLLDEMLEPEEVVVDPGAFPVLVQPLDPFHCYWTTGRNGRLLEFAHEIRLNVDELRDAYPGIEEMKEFKSLNWDTPNARYTVTDYWTETQNAILVNNTFFKKPTDHGYPGIPVIVDLSDARQRRYHDDGEYMVEGTPFCADMLDSVVKMSMGESWALAGMEETAFPILTIENVDPDESPWMQQNEKTKKSEFVFDVELGPSGRVIPSFANKSGGERINYKQMPEIAPALQQFMASQSRNAALSSFPESILTGAQTADVSGYAYAQMKQAAMARLAPYNLALNRHLSRVFMLVKDLLLQDWDLGESEMTLKTLIGQKADQEIDVPVTKEALEAVGNIRVEIQPEVPTNREAEWTLLFQAQAQQLMSKRTVINEMGIVEDPSKELIAIGAEMFAMQDPAALAGMAAKWKQEMGIPDAAPKPPPGMPQIGPGGAVPPQGAPPGAAPAGPAPGPAAGGGPVDPVMAAQLLQAVAAQGAGGQ